MMKCLGTEVLTIFDVVFFFLFTLFLFLSNQQSEENLDDKKDKAGNHQSIDNNVNAAQL